MDELLEVYSTDDATIAEIIRNALHTEGIKCEIDGERQAGLTGINSFPIRLLVLAADYDTARAFILQHEGAREETP